MVIANRFKAFFSSFVKQMFQLFQKFDSDPPPPPPSPALDPEAIAGENHHHSARPPVAGHNNVDRAIVIIAFCLASAIEIATLSVQTHSQLPPTFYLLCFAMTLAFACLLVSKFIDTKHAVAAQVLDQVGVFFAATAFFVAINIPFPLWVNSVNWTIYVASLLTILICNRF